MLRYAKAFVAAAGAAIIVLNESGVFADRPWFTMLVAAVTAAGVYQVRNRT